MITHLKTEALILEGTSPLGSMNETEAPPEEEIPEKLRATYEESVREVTDPLERAAFRRLLVANADLFDGPEG